MPSGRIEQQIDLVVKGLQDVKDAQKAVDKIDGTKAKVTIDADATKAQRTVKDVLADVKKLDSSDAQIVLAIRAAAVEKELSGILADVAALDGDQATIDVELARAAQLRGDLDELEGAIKEIDGTKATVDIDTSKATAGMDDIGKSADAARSVSANAIGNITQDLGALGGVAGSAGVAIGQFGEYFADAMGTGEESIGSIAKNFVAMAGPLTAATIGVGLLTEAFQSQAKAQAETKAFNKERVEAFTEALEDATLTTQELQKALSTGGEGRGIFVRIADQTHNVEDSVAKLFTTFQKFQNMVSEGTAGYDRWSASLVDSAKRAGASGDQITKLTRVLADARDGTLDITQNLAGLDPEFRTIAEAALAYGSAIADSAQGSKDAAFDQRFYGAALDDTTSKVNDQTDAAKQFADQMAQVKQETQDFKDVVGSVDWGGAALAGGVAGMEAFHKQFFGLADIAANTEEAFDGLAESLKDNGKGFDLNTEKGRNNQKALEDLATALDTQVAAAFADSGGDLDTFQRKVADIAAALRDRLTKEMGLSGDEADDLIRRLGLLPDDVETRYHLSQTEEARQKIQLLQSSIDALPKDVQTRVNQQILVGDYTGALATIQHYYDNHDAHVTVNGEPGNVTDAMNVMQRQLQAKSLTVLVTPVAGQIVRRDAGGAVPAGTVGVGGETGPEFVTLPDGRRLLLTQATVLPAGSRVTRRSLSERMIRSGTSPGGTPLWASALASGRPIKVDVKVSGMAGNRFEVDRAIKRSVRDGIRLAGNR